ncbi:MAG TPA: hypothetical protein VK860_07930 [Ilumatobacteraceae bacterium]|nr:hypothetical protein [Ilumatobacteraceae bacterium]
MGQVQPPVRRGGPGRSIVGLLVVSALTVAACGTSDDSSAPSGTSDAVVSEPITSGDDVLTDEQIAEVIARGEALLAMDPAEQQAEVAAAGLEVQRQLSELSGLTDELGGPEAAEAALAEAWAPIIDDVLALEGTELQLGFRRPASAPSGPSIGEGMFAGYLVNALAVDGIIQSTGNIAPERPQRGKTPDGLGNAVASIGEVELGLEASHTSDDGVQTDLNTKTVVTTCPAPDGAFSIEATVDVGARKGNVGQTGRIVVTITGRLTDDARLGPTDTTTRTEFADFGGGKGKYIDLTYKTPAGGAASLEANRGAGSVDQAFVLDAFNLGRAMSLLIGAFLERSLQKTIESGRCVQLDAVANPGPKGLEPSANSTITVTSTSKLDGQPTGGTYMATLTSGGASVDPSSSFIAIDAAVTYLAPDEANKAGSVALESRSRRGVGRATLDFDTANTSYTASGGDGEGSFSGTVDDLANAFVIDITFPGGTGTYSFEPAGDGGTLSVSGSGSGATVTGGGTYVRTDNNDGTVTLTTQTNSCVDVSNVCRDRSDTITLTPTG